MELVVGDIITMDPGRPRVTAMATDAGLVLATGSLDEVRATVPSGTAVREVPGTLIPGLIDSHLHLQWAGLKLLALAGEVALEPEEALSVLARERFSDPWPDARPTLAQRLAGLRLIQPLMLALGVTAVVDPAVVPEEMAAYLESRRRGELTLSVTAMPHPELERGAETITALGGIGVRTGMGDERLRLGGVKVYFDGEGMSATALRRDVWPQTGLRGLQRVATDTFHALALWCAGAGWSVGVHVVGGGGIDIVLDSFERVNAEVPIAGLGFSLIHAYLEPSAANMATAARLGVRVAAQPSIHYTNGAGLVRALGASAEEADPLAGWLAAGVTVGGGSDGPYFPLDPRLGLWQSRTRRVEGSERPHGPRQALTAGQALALYTTGSAAVALADRRRGRLAPGLAADWTALPLDPLVADPEAIREMWPLETVVAGAVVHTATAGPRPMTGSDR